MKIKNNTFLNVGFEAQYNVSAGDWRDGSVGKNANLSSNPQHPNKTADM